MFRCPSLSIQFGGFTTEVRQNTTRDLAVVFDAECFESPAFGVRVARLENVERRIPAMIQERNDKNVYKK